MGFEERNISPKLRLGYENEMWALKKWKGVNNLEVKAKP